MPDRTSPRKAAQVHRARVLHTTHLTPHMIRVIFGGDGLHTFRTSGHTDHYVKLLFPAPGATYPEPFDVNAIRESLPRDQWPRTRTYTVRAWDPDAAELTIDFVHHGPRGLAGPWAAAARPGDKLHLLGPGGGYAPDPTADWHLMAGDESALPAIAASLQALPHDAVAKVFIEVAGPAEEQKLETEGNADITWLDRAGKRTGTALVAAVTTANLPPGNPQAFVHGEAHFVRELRRHLRHDRGLSRDQMSISGYWRHGTDEDGWQSTKAEFNAQTEREQETAS